MGWHVATGTNTQDSIAKVSSFIIRTVH